MRFASFILITMLLPSAVAATTWIVNPDDSGDFPTLQAAIDAIGEWELDTLLLGDGVFAGRGNRELEIRLKEVHFESLSGNPATCIIDADLHHIVGEGSDLGDTRWCSIGVRNSGPFFMHRSVYVFENCEFNACEDVTDRGWAASVVFRHCRFSGCNGIDHVWDSQLAHGAEFYDCHFEGNQGNIGCFACRFYDCTFLNNSSYGDNNCIFSSSHVERCLLVGNSADRIIGIYDETGSVVDCVFLGNTGTTIAIGFYEYPPDVLIEGCTFVGNFGADDSDVRLQGSASCSIQRCLFAFRQEGSVFALDDPAEEELELVDCDVYGNAGGDWVGPIADQYGVGCNMSEHPQFCNWTAGDVSLYATSPCLPENNDCGVLIGAAGQGCDDPTAAVPPPAAAPRLAAHPNPFNPSVRLSFTLASAVPELRLAIFDATGRRVAILVDGPLPAGEHDVDWNARGLPSGVYLARLATPAGTREIKLTLLR